MFVGIGPLLFFPELISFSTSNKYKGLKRKGSEETVCSLISRILGCWAYLLMALTMGSIYILVSDILSCVVILRASVTFMKYSLKHSFICLSFDNISPFSTSMIFLLASLPENNGLKAFQNASPFLPSAGLNYCNRHVLLFYLA